MVGPAALMLLALATLTLFIRGFMYTAVWLSFAAIVLSWIVRAIAWVR
jgi:hypothetical protein